MRLANRHRLTLLTAALLAAGPARAMEPQEPPPELAEPSEPAPTSIIVPAQGYTVAIDLRAQPATVALHPGEGLFEPPLWTLAWPEPQGEPSGAIVSPSGEYVAIFEYSAMRNPALVLAGPRGRVVGKWSLPELFAAHERKQFTPLDKQCLGAARPCGWSVQWQGSAHAHRFEEHRGELVLLARAPPPKGEKEERIVKELRVDCLTGLLLNRSSEGATPVALLIERFRTAPEPAPPPREDDPCPPKPKRGRCRFFAEIVASRDPAARPFLMSLLNGEGRPWTHERAILALEEQHADTELVVLASKLGTSERIDLALMPALARRGAAGALEAVMRRFRDPKAPPLIRTLAYDTALALSKFGTDVVREGLREPMPEVARAAVKSVSTANVEGLAEDLLAAMSHPEADVRLSSEELLFGLLMNPEELEPPPDPAASDRLYRKLAAMADEGHPLTSSKPGLLVQLALSGHARGDKERTERLLARAAALPSFAGEDHGISASGSARLLIARRLAKEGRAKEALELLRPLEQSPAKVCDSLELQGRRWHDCRTEVASALYAELSAGQEFPVTAELRVTAVQRFRSTARAGGVVPEVGNVSIELLLVNAAPRELELEAVQLDELVVEGPGGACRAMPYVKAWPRTRMAAAGRVPIEVRAQLQCPGALAAPLAVRAGVGLQLATVGLEAPVKKLQLQWKGSPEGLPAASAPARK